jgi:DNA-binding CsgD family transcriptional regulator
MENKVMLKSRVLVQIFTEDKYLERGLQTINHEGLKWSKCELPRNALNQEGIVRVLLVDTECLGAHRADLKTLIEAVLGADRYAFISYSDACFEEIPHLCMRGSVEDIRFQLNQLIIILSENKQQGSSISFSRLSYAEQQLLRFLICQYSIKEIREALHLSDKEVYRLRSQVMKKYRLTNRKDLHIMLKIYEFISYINTALNKRAQFTKIAAVRG